MRILHIVWRAIRAIEVRAIVSPRSIKQATGEVLQMLHKHLACSRLVGRSCCSDIVDDNGFCELRKELFHRGFWGEFTLVDEMKGSKLISRNP
jgi:hypothetical protein